ncbi:hypothetical protein RUM43_002546 [Polyplax serrata]|uniref:Uncharacterized protein n=1 Tax=Polyplax serrata TaxID=468196 RepID=A0AAN8S2P4_POLSC
MEDELTTSVITERWSGHANLVISYDALKKLYGSAEVLNTPESKPCSIWKTDNSETFEPTYGFQKGFLVFTSIPPARSNQLTREVSSGAHTLPRSACKNEKRLCDSFSNDGLINKRFLGNDPECMSDIHLTAPFSAGREWIPEKNRGRKQCKSTYNITLTCDKPLLEDEKNKKESNKDSNEERVCNEERVNFSTHFSANILKNGSYSSSVVKSRGRGAEICDRNKYYRNKNKPFFSNMIQSDNTGDIEKIENLDTTSTEFQGSFNSVRKNCRFYESLIRDRLKGDRIDIQYQAFRYPKTKLH